MPPTLAPPQVFHGARRLLDDAGLDVAQLTVGPFTPPLTPSQRDAIDRFLAVAREEGVPVQHTLAPDVECVTVLLVNTRRA